MRIPEEAVFTCRVAKDANSEAHGRLGVRGPAAQGACEQQSYLLKRTFDFVFAASMLILGLPVLMGIAAMVKLTSKGPVLYKSQRMSEGGGTFDCLKFRTMVQDADARLEKLLRRKPGLRKEYEEALKLKNDPRLTPIGGLLRRTSLDELPQFWNVLRGEMSVVGPRPILPNERSRYGSTLHEVLAVKPGITGPWQVSGRNNLPYEARISMAQEYVDSHSFVTDLAIIARTPQVMIQRDRAGAY